MDCLWVEGASIMQQAYVVTGLLSGGRTVALDEALPATAGKVRVVVEMLPSEAPADLASFMKKLWEEQQQRGHVSRTKEAVDADLRDERENWDS